MSRLKPRGSGKAADLHHSIRESFESEAYADVIIPSEAKTTRGVQRSAKASKTPAKTRAPLALAAAEADVRLPP